MLYICNVTLTFSDIIGVLSSLVDPLGLGQQSQAVQPNSMQHDGTCSLDNPTELCCGKYCIINTSGVLEIFYSLTFHKVLIVQTTC